MVKLTDVERAAMYGALAGLVIPKLPAFYKMLYKKGYELGFTMGRNRRLRKLRAWEAAYWEAPEVPK